MKPNVLMAIILPALYVLLHSETVTFNHTVPDDQNPFPNVGAIPAPPGFHRAPNEANSFADWLCALPLKKSKAVYLYDHSLKYNQGAQFAVVDVSVGDKDLQQCADAVMRLRAEYLYARHRFKEICFRDNAGIAYRIGTDTTRKAFDHYLQNVFSKCGTLSLEKQLRSVHDLVNIQAGDVLIQGGSPGHAMIVIDVAVDSHQRKLIMLAQSYMPAQDIHIVINPKARSSPWYEVQGGDVVTPEWVFPPGHFRSWL